MVIDFGGGVLNDIAEDASIVADAQTSSGDISDLLVHVLPDGGRRATVTLVPEVGRGGDMRVYLRLDGRSSSETWSYLWEPPRVP